MDLTRRHGRCSNDGKCASSIHSVLCTAKVLLPPAKWLPRELTEQLRHRSGFRTVTLSGFTVTTAVDRHQNCSRGAAHIAHDGNCSTKPHHVEYLRSPQLLHNLVVMGGGQWRWTLEWNLMPQGGVSHVRLEHVLRCSGTIAEVLDIGCASAVKLQTMFST